MNTMKPVERIMLILSILQNLGSTDKEDTLFYRLYKVYTKRYFKANTMPHTKNGDFVEHILGY